MSNKIVHGGMYCRGGGGGADDTVHTGSFCVRANVGACIHQIQLHKSECGDNVRSLARI